MDTFRQYQTEARISIDHIATQARILAELLVNIWAKNYQVKLKDDLFQNLEEIQKKGILSRWLMSYLHTIRILGNTSVHFQAQEDRFPNSLTDMDLLVLLSSLIRVLELSQEWLELKFAQDVEPV